MPAGRAIGAHAAPHCQHYRFVPRLSIKPLENNRPADPLPEARWVLDQRPLIVLALCLAGLATLLIGVVLTWFHGLPDFRTANDYRPQVATLVLDRNGRPMDAIAREFRVVIPLKDMPPLLPRAFVAAEDSRFWEHAGLDGWSIARAAFNNLRSGRKSQGGSTITQQVTRALLLTREKSYLRKLAEAVLSHRLERMLTKEDILFIYLNEIYLGEGAYGVEAAARTYFGKKASQLELGEMALLAGLPQSPSNYSPLRAPEAARNRQRYVLNRMAEDGIISPEEARAAYEKEPRLAGEWRRAVHGYFSAHVRSQLLARYKEEDLYRRGLTVVTTADSHLQLAAAKAVREGVGRVAGRHADRPAPEGALVALETDSGRIRAMIGGADFTETQYNRAAQANRQPGSAFKPIIYAAALERGMPADAIFNDAPITLPSGRGRAWQPRNFRGEYLGPLTLTEALVRSSNVVAVQVLQRTGVRQAAQLAQKMGITAEMEPDLALALGASPVSVLELTAAFTAFANQGLYHAPVAITRVSDRDGRVYPWPQSSGKQVVSRQTADWMRAALVQVVQRGTGRAAAGVPDAGGKTGTTDDHLDAWFVGSARSLTAGVWIGHDRNQPLGPGETGGQAAAPVWKDFMQHVIN